MFYLKFKFKIYLIFLNFFFREFWIQCPEDNVLNHNLNVFGINIERE